MNDLIVVGGGLAGSEAAWQAAEQGMQVHLFEMRPVAQTGAHISSDFAELVCSNSLGSHLPDRAAGVLKNELRILGSLLLQCALDTSVPAGGALAVDRWAFSKKVTEYLTNHKNIIIHREEITKIPDGPVIIASGPLTSPSLAEDIACLTGREHLYFYDAIAPIVYKDSIDFDKAYYASRYDRGEQDHGDYINCPFERDQYDVFVSELVSAERIVLKEFELAIESGVKAGADHFFEGCLPIEILAKRDKKALAFGPMRPIGLINPHTGKWPHAVVQLRQDNYTGTMYNLVGFQTNLKFEEQKRVFRLIPGLEKAEFVRFGQMHRNTFLYSPGFLLPTLQSKKRADLFFAGQITGVEGYAGNIATGLLAGWNAVRIIRDQAPLIFPATTMLGALCQYVTHASAQDFQPMKANFGILPSLELPGNERLGKRDRAAAFAHRAKDDLEKFLVTQEHSRI